MRIYVVYDKLSFLKSLELLSMNRSWFFNL